MARSPIPAEVWAEARELYGSLPRGKAVTATVDLLARRGYAVKPNTVTQHMSQRGVTVAEGTDAGAY